MKQAKSDPIDSKIGAVVIGRNEGERLRVCLNALIGQVAAIVYVDSGSMDDSCAMAERLGVMVVALDLTQPFTAARARNSGFAQLMACQADLQFVQFVDGDCEVADTWLGYASAFLRQHPGYAVVCGRRRERFPEQSIYNQCCDLEWNTPVGDALACGGDALMRVEAFAQVQGYRESLIAGEEPELCFRLRAAGWKVWRLDQEMTLHDAAILHFSQWWKRNVRSGHAFTEGTYLHGKSAEKFWLRETRRIVLWGLLTPAVIFTMAFIDPVLSALLSVYPLQMLRIATKTQGSLKTRLSWGVLTVLGKFAEALGLLKFYYAKWVNKATQIIEYK